MKRVWLAGFAAVELGDPGARPLIYQHGFPDIPTTAGPFLRALAGHGFRIIAPWLRGYAPSPLGGPYDVDTLAADLLAIASAAGFERFDLVGHDWGALVTYAACTEAPARIGRAVAMSVPYPTALLPRLLLPSQALRSSYMAAFQLPGAGWIASAMTELLWRVWSPELHVDARHSEEVRACLETSMPAPLGPYRALVRPVGAAVERARRAARARISVPTLQLHGQRDGCIRPPPRDDRAHFTGAYRRDVIPGAGHFLAHEQPDEIADRVASWLAAGSPARK